jgi:putative DNA primase/helicase
MGGDKMSNLNFDKHNSFDNIPKELRELDRWVCWRWEEKSNKDGTPADPAKMPINPSTGGRAMSNNPATWGTFQDAVEAVKGDIQGIGFMFNGDGIIGVDIDHCREDGKLTEQAKDIVSTLDSYTEYSQSGNGVHIICYGKLPEGGRRKSSVEMYSTGRYFIVTGYTLDDGHMSIEERTEELATVHEKYINAKKQGKNEQKHIKNEQKEPVFVSDDEIIEIALAAKNGSLFEDLMNGSWQGRYSSQSEADLGLCNMLAFYAGKDHGMMDRLFRRSGLMRPKWDEKHGEGGSYGRMTIGKAITDCGTVYTPQRKKEKQLSQEAPEIDNGLDALAASVVEKHFEDTSSDMGRSKVFSDKYAGKVLWCGDFKSWLVWDDKRWNDDRMLHITQLAKKMVEEMIVSALKAISNATGEEDVKRAKAIFKDTVKAKGERSIKAMIELAKSDVSVKVEDLDGDPFLMNCQNGIVNLRTGELKKHDPSLLMTRIAGADYIPGKKFELFGEFLKLITCDDAELINYFQQICGMAAIGKVFHEGMAVFYGNGQNGKSTFLNCISKVFGDYACSINPEVLMSQRDGRQPVGITRLDGKRFVTAVELEEGRRMSSSMLKQLSSTDPITGRELYQKDRTFMPTHTLIMATNFLPKIGSSDVGTWRRIAVVPFKATIQSQNQIKDYADVLFKKDGDAILAWIIEGAIKYIRNDYHIKLPSVVEAATKDYKNAEDWVGNFTYECCEVGGYEEQGGKLYDAYTEWCEKNNEYKRRPRDFAAALETAGYEKRKTMHGALWSGLRLINPADQYSNKYRAVKSAGKDTAILDDDLMDELTRKGM